MIKTSEGTIIDIQNTIFGMYIIKAVFLNGGSSLILTHDEFLQFKKMIEDILEGEE